ncbi:glutaminyl-peptide cyclotransferase [Streptomyces sp. HNM0645]|uniref:glutaminyl-peptide cyclotransferase n=1 Tax=Streptomyces sp. HNM0645 TaxID=2782343 RepID=UPI0024B7CE93|nr:glutaminyl-peptide cyclotransferase [Streptomyces sp. HNM0645]MDI9882845.1 glutaminyl-peptide cyclotransferase [Streptomyces sp. HNM0645]
MRVAFVTPVVVLALAAGALAPSCTADGGAGGRGPAQGRAATTVERLRVEVVGTLPHDPEAFTQGLEMARGVLYESTGVSGRSTIGWGPPGAAPTRRVRLPAPLFGEGITIVGRTLWQLTWRDGVAIERDARTLAELRRVPYDGEGWGVCHQPRHGRLVTSDGSARLVFRDPGTLGRKGSVVVTLDGRRVNRLNELECVGDLVYANVWPTDRIVRIDAGTGRVTGEISANGLIGAAERRHADVLNGIAAVPGTDQFLLTGKWWPKTFRVRFVPAPHRDGAARRTP